MTSAAHATTDPRRAKEFDSVKESISDIINQLQDIDPSRLSFSPFLDLDTQISLAPVSDSPESSVEELHSPSRSIPGSQHSLEPLPTGDNTESCSRCSQSCDSMSDPPNRDAKRDANSRRVMPSAAHANCSGVHGDILPGSGPLDSTNQEGAGLVRPAVESVELTVWDSRERQECDTSPQATPCCCCQTGRVPAFCSALAALLLLPAVFYGLVIVPLEVPYCPDLLSRLVFTLRCCAVASLPIVLAMLVGAVVRFCSASLELVRDSPGKPLILQMFVASSCEQLLLYSLNLMVMATFLTQAQLKAVPVFSGIFIAGRIVYWLSLHVCSPYRGFGAGLTMFPLLVMVGFNLYYLFDLTLTKLFPTAEDIAFVNATTVPTPEPTVR